MFFGKNKISTSARSSVATENGQINSPVNKTPNLLHPEEKKRTDSFLAQPQYGKTLSVPSSNVLQVLPIVTPPAPITPPRPAIMTTPKSSTANTKLPPGEPRSLLLVTTTNSQQQPQTVTVPNGRRLPVNGRLATMAPTKQRQLPASSMMNNKHQMINETAPKTYTNNRPRTALYFPPTSMQRTRGV